MKCSICHALIARTTEKVNALNFAGFLVWLLDKCSKSPLWRTAYFNNYFLACACCNYKRRKSVDPFSVNNLGVSPFCVNDLWMTQFLMGCTEGFKKEGIIHQISLRVQGHWWHLIEKDILCRCYRPFLGLLKQWLTPLFTSYMLSDSFLSMSESLNDVCLVLNLILEC